MAEQASKEPQVGVWDQWCVLNDRPYSKEGKPALLNEDNCRQILHNFGGQPDDLSCNISHDKDRVVGFYNALALVVGGRVVDFVSHDASASPPDIAELPIGDDGSPPDDGVYWRRARITDLGVAVKQYLRKVSPEFLSEGKNVHEEPIGYVAIGGAWTNYPFLKGCELNEYEGPTMAQKKMSYAARCYEEAGVGKDDDDNTKAAKMSAYWRGKHGQSYAQFEEEAGVGKDDDAPTRMTKMSAYMAGKFGDLQITHKDDEEPGKQQMEDPVVQQGAPTGIENPKKEQDPVSGQGHSMTLGGVPQQYQAALQQLPALLRKNAEQEQRIKALQDAQDKATKDAAAHKFVQAAWAEGRIVPFPSESEAQAQARFVNQYTQFGKASAEGNLAPKGTYAVREMTASPLTFQFTAPDSPGAKKGEHPDEALLRLARAHQAENKVPERRFIDSVRAVCIEHPHLYQQYSVQGRAALFEGILPGFGQA